VEEFQSVSKSDAKEKVRASIRGRMRIGGLMCVTAPLLFFAMFFAHNSLPQIVMRTLFIPLCVIGVLGVLVVVYYGTGSRMLFQGIDVLDQIAPPEPFVEGRLAVLNKDPVYVIIQWGSNALIFVAFLQSERTFDKSVMLPRVIWKWEYNHPIGDIKVARREDSFTIPVDRDTYYTGKGILYSLLLEETVIVTLQKSYSTEELNLIVDALAQEVDTYGSSSRLFDDDFE
jgi:hypothetical protein